MDEIELVCDRVLVLSNGVIKAEFCTPNINTDSLLLAALEDH
jgi:ABC-type sugar transport system ATPase subunit